MQVSQTRAGHSTKILGFRNLTTCCTLRAQNQPRWDGWHEEHCWGGQGRCGPLRWYICENIQPLGLLCLWQCLISLNRNDQTESQSTARRHIWEVEEKSAFRSRRLSRGSSWTQSSLPCRRLLLLPHRFSADGRDFNFNLNMWMDGGVPQYQPE